VATDYTPQQRDQARAVYEQHGTSEAARLTCIPKGTIASWATRHGWQTVCTERNRAMIEAWKAITEERRQGLAGKLFAYAEALADELVEEQDQTTVTASGQVVSWRGKHSARNRYALARAVGVLIDRADLLSGQASRMVVTSGQVEAEAREAVVRLIRLVEQRTALAER
jgi:hypothetical protein